MWRSMRRLGTGRRLSEEGWCAWRWDVVRRGGGLTGRGRQALGGIQQYGRRAFTTRRTEQNDRMTQPSSFTHERKTKGIKNGEWRMGNENKTK